MRSGKNYRLAGDRPAASKLMNSQATPVTSSCSSPPPFWLCLMLSRLFKCVIFRLLYLRVVNIHCVTLLLSLYAREGRAGIFMNDIYWRGWFLSCSHVWKIHGTEPCYFLGPGARIFLVFIARATRGPAESVATTRPITAIIGVLRAASSPVCAFYGLVDSFRERHDLGTIHPEVASLLDILSHPPIRLIMQTLRIDSKQGSRGEL